MRKKTRKGVIQMQSVRQNVNVIVQTAPPRRKRKSSTGANSRRNLFESITSQNIREGRKREGVARAVERYGSKIHHVMPYEQLERITGGTSSIVWNRNEPEQVNVPRMGYVKPDDVGYTDRPYLREAGTQRDMSTKKTTGRRPTSLATTSQRLMESVRFGGRPASERVLPSEETSD